LTANPKWPEITRALLPGQTAYDRPDLVARVFALKRDAMLHEIYHGGILGTPAAYIYSTEFQKRGLPHCHALIILHDPWKMKTVDAIDSIISAEWPDPTAQPRLFDIV
ncbi:hypothetical protein K523DRAFT_196747, partial [Schizophyllum commune Tattone D]